MIIESRLSEYSDTFVSLIELMCNIKPSKTETRFIDSVLKSINEKVSFHNMVKGNTYSYIVTVEALYDVIRSMIGANIFLQPYKINFSDEVYALITIERIFRQNAGDFVIMSDEKYESLSDVEKSKVRNRLWTN